VRKSHDLLWIYNVFLICRVFVRSLNSLVLYHLVPLSDMSQATTTTTTWTVSKYSRCYVNHAAVTSGDWQHYTTPIIHLLLERTIGNDGSLVAIRLRVMWKMHGSNSASVVGEEVVFASTPRCDAYMRSFG
jgi:hypothetical protein